MNINFNQLRSFLMVAEEGHLTHAAERRHTTPSAVSAHLRQLEDVLGVQLFERTRQGMKLTAEGERLLPSARRVIGATRDFADLAAALNGNLSRSVRLGLNAPPEHLAIGPLIAASARGEPPLVVQLESSMSERIIVDVVNGRLDAGFVYGQVEDRVLAREPLGQRRLRVAVPGNSDIEALPDDPAARLALPWIWPGIEDCPFARIMSVILGGQEADANIITRTDGEEAARALIRAGMGIGLLEERYAFEASGDGGLRMLEPYWNIDLGLIYRADRGDDPALLSLLGALRATHGENEAA